jgi:dTDP-4-dehydrorhamnose 3,5-epimerase
MEFQQVPVVGAFVVRPERRGDDRGWFARVFCVREFSGRGLEAGIAQVNLAASSRAGTVRGLHYQLPPSAEAKLVRCVDGGIYDVVVDLRQGSPTLGQWSGVHLTADEGNALYVPPGCAHGYQSMTDGARALYQASAPYVPEHERGVHHADPALAITWPLEPVNLSEKDRALPPLSQAELTAISPSP